MSDNVSEEHPDAPSSEEDDFMSATFSFTYKTYLFAGTRKAKLIHPKEISTFLSTYVSTMVSTITYDKIDSFQEEYPNKQASALIILRPNEIDDF